MLQQQGFEPLLPVVLRTDAAGQPSQVGKDVVEPAAVPWIEACHQRLWTVAGQPEGERELPVPQSAVVGTEVADGAQVVQEGRKVGFVHVRRQ